ncbi:MAG: glycoside hydrolase family 57 protein [Tenuifilaceae bacterium]
MKTICFYFQVHQPFRLRRYRFFDIGEYHNYFDDFSNRSIMRKVADKCYLPTNYLMLDLINEFGSRFKISYSISGTALDQFEMYAPEVLESFRKLAETGCVEFINETYSHSLSALKNRSEFERQVLAQGRKVEELFGKKPTTFRNTELIYSDEIGSMVADLGFKAMLTEGAKHILGWKSSNYLYTNAINPKLKLLLKNFRLSDDIAFRFSNRGWSEWPLTAEKYIKWLNAIEPRDEIVNLFMDYETFGEHQWEDTGIFNFMRALPQRVFSDSNFEFLTPSEAADKHQPVSALHVPFPISWADEERDLTAWLGNDLQDEAFNNLYSFAEKVDKIDDPELNNDWKYLQTSDHFYYMCTKWFSDGDVHKYFNPYDTPYEAFINFMNILSDFSIRVENKIKDLKELNILPPNLSSTDVEKMIKELEDKVKELKRLKTKKASPEKKVTKKESTTLVEKKKKIAKPTKPKTVPAKAKKAEPIKKVLKTKKEEPKKKVVKPKKTEPKKVKTAAKKSTSKTASKK